MSHIKSLTKRYVRKGSICKVTFRLPKEALRAAKKVNLVGEFNKWSFRASPMRALKSGDFSLTVDLESGREYRFKYLIDGQRWENDWDADRYEENVYGSDDSVVVV